MSESEDALERALGYRFSDSDLLRQALTHKSHGSHNNERLEFLGDAVLGFVVADLLYRRRPELPENDMTVVRASLVRKDALASVARRLGLGQFLRLGSGEHRSGGFDRSSILADALEAVIGAVHLDGGIEKAAALIESWMADPIETLDPNDLKDAKTRLQELLQGFGRPLPEYTVANLSGKDHAREFVVQCELTDTQEVFRANGTSRRAGEKAAAALALASMSDQEGQAGQTVSDAAKRTPQT
ncbi:MAG: ribonuclease III [Pseudomonadaceae bacterium]|nr:ribonuclease III [Pseudomonadaceae bacterium]